MVVCRVMLRKWVVWWTLAHRRFVSPCFFGPRVPGSHGSEKGRDKRTGHLIANHACVFLQHLKYRYNYSKFFQREPHDRPIERFDQYLRIHHKKCDFGEDSHTNCIHESQVPKAWKVRSRSQEPGKATPIAPRHRRPKTPPGCLTTSKRKLSLEKAYWANFP
jgi:hypothetical protein